ncbi:MAG: PqiC family protein [Methylococcales bacterium]
MLNSLRIGMLAVLQLLLPGCAATPTPQFYLLEALSKPAASTISSSQQRIIGLGPVSIPAVLERKQIVSRAIDNSVQIAELQQWAAPLKPTITEVVSQNIGRLLPNYIVRTYPWNAYGDVQYRVLLDIIRFDTNVGKTAHLDATWAIIHEKNHAVISNGHTVLEKGLTDPSYPTAVKALSALLDNFSQELAKVLTKQLP